MADLTNHPRYSWLIGLVVFLSFTLTIGIPQYSFGVFITPLEQEFGWSRTEVNVALAFYVMAGIGALPVGWALDRFGARPVMLISIAMLAVAQLLRPWMTDLWHLYALSAIQFAALPGAAMITGARIVGVWFDQNRGRAMGLTAMGANFGGIVFASLSAILIDAIGWRQSYFVYGLLFCALMPVIYLTVRERPAPSDYGDSDHASNGTARLMLGATLAEALRSRVFYMVVLALLLTQLSYQSVLPQIVPHLENVGISRSEAAAALSTMALFGMSGKVLMGWFCERYPARYALIVSLACEVVGILILLVAGASPWIWIAVPVFGFGFGSLGSVIPLLSQETFGLRSFGTVFGLINFLTLWAALIGPPLVGVAFDATGSYRLAFLTISALFVVAMAVIFFTRPLTGSPRVQTAAVSEVEAR